MRLGKAREGGVDFSLGVGTHYLDFHPFAVDHPGMKSTRSPRLLNHT